MKWIALPVFAASLLAGCSTSPTANSSGDNEMAAPKAKTSPTPANTTVETTPKANCPTESGAGPDVLGVRLGTSADDAFALLKCGNPNFSVEYSTEAHSPLPPMPDGSLPRTGVLATANGDLASVYLMGPTGREKVILVTREFTFADGGAPTVVDLIASLQAKYGPSEVVSGNGNTMTRTVARSPKGQPFAVGSADFQRCTRTLGWNSDGQFSTEAGCGLTINIRIERRTDNPSMARVLFIAIADQEKAVQFSQQTQREIRSMSQQPRAAGPIPAPTGAAVPKL